MKLGYNVVDAFVGPGAAGNPAAVVQIAEHLEESEMQAVARELALPATAFVRRGQGAFAIRWFSPTGEIRLCGHGLLAAAHVVLGGAGPAGAVFATRHAGTIDVVRKSGGGFELAMPTIAAARADWPEATALLGGAPLEVWRSPHRYAVAFYASEAEVRALAPDLAGLSALGDHQITCTAPGLAVDVVSRVFVGGREDSATGSAHAVLTPLWSARLARDSFTAHQASDRGGDLTCRVDGERAWIGGQCRTVGEFAYSAG